MRRLVVLVTVVVLMMAMLAASAGGAQGLSGTSGQAEVERTRSGVPVDLAVCEVLADDSALFEWRAGGEVCWVNSPVSADDF